MICTGMYVHLWLCAFLGSFIFFHFVAPRFMFCIFVACGKSTDFCMCSCVVYPKAQHVAMVKSGLFLLLLNQNVFIPSFLHCLPYPSYSSFLHGKQMNSNSILWILGVWSCCFRISRIWMVWPRQPGISGCKIRSLDLSGCTLFKVCA